MMLILVICDLFDDRVTIFLNIELNTIMTAITTSRPPQLVVGDKSYEITPAMVTSVAKVSKTEHVREFVPSVVEPSFGIGRILYCILECNFKVLPCLSTLPHNISTRKTDRTNV